MNLQEKKKDLQESISIYENRIKALENIKRMKTKNGKDFKTLSKNFTNCTFKKPDRIYEWNKDERKISISFQYINKRNNKAWMFEELYFFGLNKITTETPATDIENAIKDLIEKNKRYLRQAKKTLELFDDVMKEFQNDILKATQKMKNIDIENDLDRKFYYIAIDYLHSYY